MSRREGNASKTDLGGGIQLAADLNLILFDRPLHPELFRHYADFHVSQSRYHADIWVTGLSHVVTVSAGQRSLTELIGGDHDVLPTRGVVTRFRMKGERDLERTVNDSWQYTVSTQVENMEEPLYKSVHFDLWRYANKREGFCAYEQWAEVDMAPFSLIDTEARDGEFHVHAFHAFPQERTVVKTQSIFEIPR